MEKPAVDLSSLYSYPMALAQALASKVTSNSSLGRGLAGAMAGGLGGGLAGALGTSAYNALVDDPEEVENSRWYRNAMLGAGAGALGLGAAEATGLTNPLYKGLYSDVLASQTRNGMPVSPAEEKVLRDMLARHPPHPAVGDPSVDRTKLRLGYLPHGVKGVAMGDTLVLDPDSPAGYAADPTYGRDDWSPPGIAWFPGVAAHEVRHTLDMPQVPGMLPSMFYRDMHGALENRAWSESVAKGQEIIGRQYSPAELQQILSMNRRSYQAPFSEGDRASMLAAMAEGRPLPNVNTDLARLGVRAGDYTSDPKTWGAVLGAGGLGALGAGLIGDPMADQWGAEDAAASEGSRKAEEARAKVQREYWAKKNAPAGKKETPHRKAAAMTHPYWSAFIKQAAATGLDAIHVVGLYTVATEGGARNTDQDFFHALEKSGMDLSDLRYVQGLVQKSAQIQDSAVKEEKNLSFMQSIQKAQQGIDDPLQDSSAKEDANLELMGTLQDAQTDGECDSLEEQEDMQNRGAGTDTLEEAAESDDEEEMEDAMGEEELAKLAYYTGFQEVIEKAAQEGWDPAMLGALAGGMGRGGNSMSMNMNIPPGIGTGMDAWGLSQLMQADPRTAGLARANMEASSARNAMGPFEGMGPGVLAGGLGGAGLGALGGGLAGANSELGAGLGAGLGALGGGLMGGGMGALVSQGLEAQQRSADAFKRAIAKYEAGEL